MLDTLNRVIKDCHLCPLNDDFHLPVPGVGNMTPRVMLIAEAPGAEESHPSYYPDSEYGVPLVGEAGNALQEVMADLGFAEYSMFITNVVKHRPPNNRPPTDQEKRTCSVFTEHQLVTLRPPHVIAFGKHASETIRRIVGLPPLLDTQPSRGIHYSSTYKGIHMRIWNVYHPSYALLRAPHKKIELIKDLQDVLQWLQKEKKNA